MAGFITPVAKKFLLDAIVGKVPSWAGGGSNRTVYLGLAHAVPPAGAPNLATVTEVTVAGYGRIAVTWDAAGIVDPVFVDNTSDLSIGPVTTDMPPVNYAFLTERSTGNAIAVPVLTNGGASAGGTRAAGTFYWKITAINAQGETTGSNEISQALTTNQKMTLNWSAITGATGYKIYRGTSSGNQDTLVATVGLVTTYNDLGTEVTSLATPPASNTAPIGDILYVWELAEPVSALANKPILVPASALVIE